MASGLRTSMSITVDIMYRLDVSYTFLGSVCACYYFCFMFLALRAFDVETDVAVVCSSALWILCFRADSRTEGCANLWRACLRFLGLLSFYAGRRWIVPSERKLGRWNPQVD